MSCPRPPPASVSGPCLLYPPSRFSRVAHLGLPELLPLCPGMSRLDPCWSLLTSLCPLWALPTLHTETSSQNARLRTLGQATEPCKAARASASTMPGLRPPLPLQLLPSALHLAFCAAAPLALIHPQGLAPAHPSAPPLPLTTQPPHLRLTVCFSEMSFSELPGLSYELLHTMDPLPLNTYLSFQAFIHHSGFLMKAFTSEELQREEGLWLGLLTVCL